MTAPLPFISVVVPAHNRPDSLRCLLSALEDQSYPPYRFEVIISDDGSVPPLLESIEPRGYSFPVKVVEGPNAGPATARNRGVVQAAGTIIAFTDDDCIPDPGWLDAIADGFQTSDTYAIHGPTVSSVPPIDPFIHSVHIDRHHGVATANFAVRRENLQAVKGFDPTFAIPYFEDEDLSRRLQGAYGPISWSEAMRVVHPPRPGTIAGAWTGASYFRYLPYMQAKHPGYGRETVRKLLVRVALKSTLLLGTLTPWLGLGLSGWAGVPLLFGWQLWRLRNCRRFAQSHGARIPSGFAVWFVHSEWLLDYRRLAAYVSGWSLKEAPEFTAENGDDWI